MLGEVLRDWGEGERLIHHTSVKERRTTDELDQDLQGGKYLRWALPDQGGV